MASRFAISLAIASLIPTPAGGGAATPPGRDGGDGTTPAIAGGAILQDLLDPHYLFLFHLQSFLGQVPDHSLLKHFLTIQIFSY